MAPPRRLRIPNNVADTIRSLHPHIKSRIRAGLDSILLEPTAGKPLRGDLSGLWTFRVGRFRIVYRHPPGRIVEIVALGPRRTIYAETFRLISRSPHRRGQGDPEDPS